MYRQSLIRARDAYSSTVLTIAQVWIARNRNDRLRCERARDRGRVQRGEHGTSWLALLLVVSLAVVWPAAFAQAGVHPDPRGEQSGTLFLKSSEDADPIEALRVATSIRAEVTGNLARVQRLRIVLGGEVPRLTLVTCYPFDAIVPGGPLRWVVTADRIQNFPVPPASSE